jgi:hypothetical protein
MENLKIKQRTEDMIKYGYIALRQFPKSENCNGKKTIESFLTGIMAAAPQPALNFNDQKVLRAS